MASLERFTGNRVPTIMTVGTVNTKAPKWHYGAPSPAERAEACGVDVDVSHLSLPNLEAINLGNYSRENVTNINSPDPENRGRIFFDVGLRHMLSYQHEMASKCFQACLHYSPYCALAHALVALCHSPNYNFKGDPYYNSTDNPDEIHLVDHLCKFPSQHVAERHSRMAVERQEELRKMHRKSGGKRGKKNKASSRNKPSQQQQQQQSNTNQPQMISPVESQLIAAVRILTCNPGLEASLADELAGRPYANAMRKVYEKFKDDAEVNYLFAESLMVLNAWELFEYPTGKPKTQDVMETRAVLERALEQHAHHAGLCHLYVHLSEMSSDPGQALTACVPLRTEFPHAGHLVHMATHIDVLVGDYEAVVRCNADAIAADLECIKHSPDTAGMQSFYFGYIVHNFHMLVYGAILGGMEAKAMECAKQLNGHLTEDVFRDNEDLAAYLESYSALDIHTMVRFGRWKEILELDAPNDATRMLFRSATLLYARALSYANLGDIDRAKEEAARFDVARNDPRAEMHILHNNSVANLLEVDAPMLRGEIAYREGKHEDAFRLLRKAIKMQDNLRYDEPWGKMQPIRHALGGLLLEQGQLEESEEVFREDLKFHPKNPWALVGLINCLKQKSKSSCCGSNGEKGKVQAEIESLESDLETQRKCEWADYDITVACECCKHP